MTTSTRCNIAASLRNVALVVTAGLLAGCSAIENGQMTFRTPEKAVQAVADVAGTDDVERTEAIFGPGSAELLSSGDEVADRNAALKVKEEIQEKVAFEDLDSKTKIPVLGDDHWQFPIPLVRVRRGWRFDTAAGAEEITNRRVGRNELSTIATLHAIVDAQKEYFAGRHDGHSHAYAQRLISTPGKQDGLCWETAEGEEPSPLGPLVAEAGAEGYATGGTEPTPYHGYFYRLLTAQGSHAPGGARSYIDKKGLQTGGFALIAWPAKYDNSGVMSFLVDKQGIVFQKDLGPQTSEVAATVVAYDPDQTWAPTAD